MIATRPAWVKHFVPVSWILLLAGLVLTSRNVVEPTPWSLGQLIAAGTAEAAGLFLILRPLSFDYNAGRCLTVLLALLIASTWWAVKAPTVAVPTYTLHLLWLMFLIVVSCVLLGFSLWQQLMNRHRPRSDH